jgi:hypothetical protein
MMGQSGELADSITKIKSTIVGISRRIPDDNCQETPT